MDILDELLQKIYDRHDIYCNQKYGNQDLPYSFHLRAVVTQAKKYGANRLLLVAAAGHDLIEDARMTYNELIPFLSSISFLSIDQCEEVKNIIYCCTEEKGHNRDERHSKKFFAELALNRNAVFIKLCDIKANVIYSKLVNSSMYEKYKKEFPRVKTELYIKNEFEQLWKDLESEFN